MALKGISRKDFIKTSALGVTGFMTAPSLLGFNGTVAEGKYTTTMVLKNVRLETGFIYEEGEVVATRTGLFCVEINDGIIGKITPYDPAAEGEDAGGMLMLPAFKDMHIHLDKTFYGGPWKAVRKRQGGVKGMIALEQELLPEMLKTSTHRAEKIVELLQSRGTAFARSHVNIEPTSGMKSLENLEKALQHKKGSFGAELVAFPQHGIYYTDSAGLMAEAAAMDSICYIGGLDPYTIDGNIERSVDFMVRLALDHNKGIDMHLHETGDSGLRTVTYLIEKVNENPKLRNRTFLSHCFVLGKIPASKQEEIAEKLAHSGIGVISTIPFGGLVMPLPTLYKYGVDVATGNDSIIDHWNTWGSGSVLEKANLMAQLYGYRTEFDLSRSLKLATHNILPLDDEGNRQWPKAGDEASVVLVDASCSAEAVSRISPVHSLLYRGQVVF